jgi:hypothetical protein
MRSFQEPIIVLNAAAATGVGITLDVAAYKTIVLEFHTTGSANFTAKVQGSVGVPPGANFETQRSSGMSATPATQMIRTAPLWANSQSPTNPWTYLQLVDLADQSTINGATGLVAAGTDVNRQFEVNTNGQNFITVNITNYAAGAITVLAQTYNIDE